MAGAKGKSGGARKGAGRKGFAPTADLRQQVQALAEGGASQIHIAQRIGASVPTLVLQFRHEVKATHRMGRKPKRRD